MSGSWWPALLLALCSCVLMESQSSYRLEGQAPSSEGGFSNALYQATGIELLPGNKVELANNGYFFDVLANDLNAAQKSITIVVFIWRPGDPSDQLLPIIFERAKAGVDCRIIVDTMVSVGFKSEVKPKLEAAGCKVRLARQELTLHRNHRKIIVIDGTIGFTGGLGIHKSWLGNGRRKNEWRDSNVRVEGPVVTQMQQAFAENWVEETGTLLPQSFFPHLEPKGEMYAAFVGSSASHTPTKAERLSHLALAAAKKRAWIANAYFLPSPGLTKLILEKRAQGVEVLVMAPSEATDQPDILEAQRNNYPALMKAGVRFFEYQPSMFHPKTVVVDDTLSIVGSINLDRLSQEWLEEGSLVVYDRAFAHQMERDWIADEQHCREIHP